MATLEAVRRSKPITSARERSFEKTRGKIKRGWQLYLMLLIPLINSTSFFSKPPLKVYNIRGKWYAPNLKNPF
jgi:hypothetical protein